ncbi:hypothetical protein FHS85_000061 [Rhodoligotrophos appendicifer]|uniref:hypothetical protein n=1 Tax=Rhodoligotrophos appendicifer TaxID=987056 RepID=UPI00117DA9ED|nr:hypothetical protein [Rhodoligotrophos appendicifer]
MSDNAAISNSEPEKPESSISAENKNEPEMESEVSINIGTMNFHIDKVVIAQIDELNLSQGLSNLFNMGHGSSAPRAGSAPSRSMRSIDEGDARPSNYGIEFLDDGTSMSI